MLIKLIEFKSLAYNEAVEIRNKVLRRPLGLKFDQRELDQEFKDYHIAFIDSSSIIGVLLLTPKENGMIQMRQVAVRPSYQGMGIGRKLVRYAEAFAYLKGYEHIMLHARKESVLFYQKLSYLQKGQEFLEINIPHYYMEKTL